MILDKETKLKYCRRLANHFDAIHNFTGASMADGIAVYIDNNKKLSHKQWAWLRKNCFAYLKLRMPISEYAELELPSMPQKRGRGRPKGSKNRPKITIQETLQRIHRDMGLASQILQGANEQTK